MRFSHLLCTAALVFLTVGARADPDYTAAPVTVAESGDLLNGHVNAFNNHADYTLRLFVPGTGTSPSLRQTSLVTGETDAAVQAHIPTLGSDLSNIAFGLNDSGGVVGVSFELNVQPNFSQRDAFYRASGGLPIQLPRIDHGGSAKAINNSDVIVGHSFTDAAGNDQVAARWTPDGSGGWSVQNLGTFGLASSDALDVNNLGQTLVEASNVDGSVRTYHIVDLDGSSVELTPPTAGFFGPSQVNDLGQVIASEFDGLLWDPAQGFVDTGLDRLHGLNNLGQAVGQVNGPGGFLDTDAYLWDNGTLTKLEDVVGNLDDVITGLAGTRLQNARHINDNGHVLAYTDKFFDAALLLTPVPEPGALTLLAGMGALLTLCRCRGGYE